MRYRDRTYAILLTMLLVVALSLSGCGTEDASPTPAPTFTPLVVTATRPPAPTDTSAPSPTETPVRVTDTPQPTSMNPTVAIAPTSGPPGTVVQVNARGFPPDAEVQLGAGRENSEYDILFTARTDAEGTLTDELAIPSFADPQDPWVVVVTTSEGTAEALSNTFQVTEPAGEPTVVVTPQTVAPGETVQIVAQGFPPDAVIELGIGRPNSEYDVVGDASADSAGRVDTSMTIPAFVEPEDQWVIVVATQDHATKAISSVLQVTGEAAATATAGPSISRTQIYLIAVGDDGQAGKEIGCDDSVVPVEIEIEPTIAPLTAALERLLSIETREYGQSGLYNALYRSDLSVEGINIVAGEARVALSGTLNLGGVCDNPRVKAQLSETALQYATVDRVSITINGTPLDDLLALR